MSNSFVQIFLNVSMSNGHDGLTKAIRNKGKVESLKPGQFFLFLNRKCSAFKLLGANSIVLHYRHPKNHMLNPKALRLVPEFMSDTSIGYEEAQRKVITEYMRKELGRTWDE